MIDLKLNKTVRATLGYPMIFVLSFVSPDGNVTSDIAGGGKTTSHFRKDGPIYYNLSGLHGNLTDTVSANHFSLILKLMWELL